jgi:hypothetical protein
MKNFHRIGGDAIEDEVIALRGASHAAVLMTRHQRIGARHFGQPRTTVLKLVDEREGAYRIVLGDPVADLKKIGLRLVGKDELRRPRASAFC